jgi:hypothetical protein
VCEPPEPAPEEPPPPPPPTGATILWSADHEEGSLADWYYPETGEWGNYGGGEYNSGTGDSYASTSVSHTGNYSARMSILDTSLASSGTRLFRWRESRANPRAYYSAWLYFPDAIRHVDGWGWTNFFQFKSKSATRNDPILALALDYTYDAAQMYFMIEHKPPDGSSTRRYQQRSSNVPVGRWFHLEAYLEQSASGTGRMTVWQDGVQILDAPGISTRYSDGDNQWAINAYGAKLVPDDLVIYVDDAAVATERLGP